MRMALGWGSLLDKLAPKLDLQLAPEKGQMWVSMSESPLHKLVTMLALK